MQEPKKSLRPCKYRSQEDNHRQTPTLSEAWLDHPAHLEQYLGSPGAGSAQNETTRPRTRYRFSDSLEALRHKASDEVPILRLAQGPARKASDEVPNVDEGPDLPSGSK